MGKKVLVSYLKNEIKIIVKKRKKIWEAFRICQLNSGFQYIFNFVLFIIIFWI